jgi:homoserine kinase
MTNSDKRVSVMAPASIGNLGPGFDCLSLAVTLYLRVKVEPSDHGLEVELAGRDMDGVPANDKNLVLQSMACLFRHLKQDFPSIHVKIDNEIPLSSGLGSSAAAIVAGLDAANRWLEEPLPPSVLLRFAAEIEGHPDNVAAAQYGGFTISAIHQGSPNVRRFQVDFPHRIVAVHPPIVGATRDMRAILSPTVSREDAVFSLANTAHLVSAFSLGDLVGLRPFFEDRLHQEQRRKLLPYLHNAIEAAYSAGAYGAFLSGSGPTVGAITGPQNSDTVAAKMVEAISETVAGTIESFILRVDNQGVRDLRKEPCKPAVSSPRQEDRGKNEDSGEANADRDR